MQKSWQKSLRGSMGKRQKNLGDRSQKKKRRNLVGNYQGNLWLNYYIAGGEEDMKGKERGGGMKTRSIGKIPQDKES